MTTGGSRRLVPVPDGLEAGTPVTHGAGAPLMNHLLPCRIADVHCQERDSLPVQGVRSDRMSPCRIDLSWSTTVTVPSVRLR